MRNYLPVQEHDVIFSILAEEGGSPKLTQAQAAKSLSPPICWNSKRTKIAWQMKWSLNGIQPQRAVVVLHRTPPCLMARHFTLSDELQLPSPIWVPPLAMCYLRVIFLGPCKSHEPSKKGASSFNRGVQH